jgi:hypothetical protein
MTAPVFSDIPAALAPERTIEAVEPSRLGSCDATRKLMVSLLGMPESAGT